MNLWDEILARIETKVNRHSFYTWFRPTTFVGADRVSVTVWNEGEMTHLDLEVAPSDRGRVIGRRGATADALRAVLEAVGRRRGTPCDVEILD